MGVSTLSHIAWFGGFTGSGYWDRGLGFSVRVLGLL